MPSEIIVAVIGAISGIIGSFLTLVVSLRQLRLEKQRLEKEIQRWGAEVKKIQAETQEILRRLDEQRLQKLKELRNCLDVFERQGQEDPIGMFAALRQLRQSLDESLVFLSQDLRTLVDDLRSIEIKICADYPEIAQLVNEQGDALGKSTYGERREKAEKRLGYDYWRVRKFLEEVRSKINPQLDSLRKELFEAPGHMTVSKESTVSKAPSGNRFSIDRFIPWRRHSRNRYHA
jgi:DNA repair exonuclease SbcCD ATPase subunit